MVTTHDVYLALGRNEKQRCARYRALFDEALPFDDRQAIRGAVRACLPLGCERFLLQIERQLGRSIGYAHRGRPYAKLAKNKSLRPLY